jgi:GTP-binding protein
LSSLEENALFSNLVWCNPPHGFFRASASGSWGRTVKATRAEFVVSAAAPAQFPRDGLPEIAFAGRSNVGKSSLLNRLVGRKGLALTSKTPGRTRLLNFFRINDEAYFVDLPGYGYAAAPKSLRETWGGLVEGYLRGRAELRGVVFLLDIRHEPTGRDLEMRGLLDETRLPWIPVLTKADKVGRNERGRLMAQIAHRLSLADPGPAIPFSAVTGEGTRELWSAIAERLRAPAC